MVLDNGVPHFQSSLSDSIYADKDKLHFPIYPQFLLSKDINTAAGLGEHIETTGFTCSVSRCGV